MRLSVFTREWVSKNLQEFLEGASASAIVTLGEEAIESKAEVEALELELANLTIDIAAATTAYKKARDDAYGIAHKVQNQMVIELKKVDHEHFTKNRYNAPRLAEDLAKFSSKPPTDEAYTESLSFLADPPPEYIRVNPVKVSPTPESLDQIQKLMILTPQRTALLELANDRSTQSWVEAGLELHNGRTQCKFCANEISNGRLAALLAHFDDSWGQLREQANSYITLVEGWIGALETWQAELPHSEQITISARGAYARELAAIQAATTDRKESLKKLHLALMEKSADPSSIPEIGELTGLADPTWTDQRIKPIEDHNAHVGRYHENREKHRRRCIGYLVGTNAKDYKKADSVATELQTQIKVMESRIDATTRSLEAARAAQFTTQKMALALTEDLERVYGRNHLAVTIAPDGKSYFCRRGVEPATHLSEGEQMSLALLYFLRRLEQADPEPSPASHLVVIDDPSSSLDREAIFSTHQWLIQALDRFDQSIILTHDFNLLRLLLMSRKNAWGKSLKKLRDGKQPDDMLPSVTFLEICAVTDKNGRRSSLAPLPELLNRSTTEYGYLFAMVMQGVMHEEDHERLFLLPNAARRVIEVFASYKAPHRTDFMQQLEVLVISSEGEPFRDVYDFCNRFSHGEGHESIDVLDARAVHRQIRRCMEFLRAIDSEHFARMCEATDVPSDCLDR